MPRPVLGDFEMTTDEAAHEIVLRVVTSAPDAFRSVAQTAAPGARVTVVSSVTGLETACFVVLPVIANVVTVVAFLHAIATTKEAKASVTNIYIQNAEGDVVKEASGVDEQAVKTLMADAEKIAKSHTPQQPQI